MNFEHGRNEASKRSILHGGDPRVHEAVETVREGLRQPMPSGASAKPHYGTTIAMKNAADETAVPLGRRTLGPLTAVLGRRVIGRTSSLMETVPQTRTLSVRTSARIAIKAKGRILFIDAADAIAVEAKGNYVLLLHASSSHMLRESISTMEEKLNLHGFVRIHRSVLVNAALVEEIQPWSTGEYVLRMRGGREYTVTRTYKKNLQLLAQLWIGMDGFVAE
jgi:DNA-binding LytR/AlgR family response regulator